MSTRWYRSPELLVGDESYGKPVDMWAVGCMFAEISNGLPLFPGDSDVDQLFHIMRTFGPLPSRLMELMSHNPLFVGVTLPDPESELRPTQLTPLEDKIPTMTGDALALLKMCLRYEPSERASCDALLNHPYFTAGRFAEWFEPQLQAALEKDAAAFVLRHRGRRGGKRRSDADGGKSKRRNSVGRGSASGADGEGKDERESKREEERGGLSESKLAEGAATAAGADWIDPREKDLRATTGLELPYGVAAGGNAGKGADDTGGAGGGGHEREKEVKHKRHKKSKSRPSSREAGHREGGSSEGKRAERESKRAEREGKEAEREAKREEKARRHKGKDKGTPPMSLEADDKPAMGGSVAAGSGALLPHDIARIRHGHTSHGGRADRSLSSALSSQQQQDGGTGGARGAAQAADGGIPGSTLPHLSLAEPSARHRGLVAFPTLASDSPYTDHAGATGVGGGAVSSSGSGDRVGGIDDAAAWRGRGLGGMGLGGMGLGGGSSVAGGGDRDRDRDRGARADDGGMVRRLPSRGADGGYLAGLPPRRLPNVREDDGAGHGSDGGTGGLGGTGTSTSSGTSSGYNAFKPKLLHRDEKRGPALKAQFGHTVHGVSHSGVSHAGGFGHRNLKGSGLSTAGLNLGALSVKPAPARRHGTQFKPPSRGGVRGGGGGGNAPGASGGGGLWGGGPGGLSGHGYGTVAGGRPSISSGGSGRGFKFKPGKGALL